MSVKYDGWRVFGLSETRKDGMTELDCLESIEVVEPAKGAVL